jgi:hypothetical protein
MYNNNLCVPAGVTISLVIGETLPRTVVSYHSRKTTCCLSLSWKDLNILCMGSYGLTGVYMLV